MATKVVVVGAGVSGLTTALQLCKNHDVDVTIIAMHVPGDYDIQYASPWAGANYFPFSKLNTNAQQYEKETWSYLENLATHVPESGIHFQDAFLYRRAKDNGTAAGSWFADLVSENPWFKDVVPKFRVLQKSELPDGTDGGTTFTSVCINTGLYLPWLASQCMRRGVRMRQIEIKHIAEAANLHFSGKRADVVVNCTGLSSLKLDGVNDQAMYPARGQIVVVRNSPGGGMFTVSGTDDGPLEAMYIMQRPGGGTILGGCLQADNWESQPDPNLAVRIMKRCVKYCPSLVPEGKGIEGLSIIRHGVGLRPMRNGGVRIEKEVISFGGQDVLVLHNYGHGGGGYQMSYGCAKAVEKLLLDVQTQRAKL